MRTAAKFFLLALLYLAFVAVVPRAHAETPTIFYDLNVVTNDIAEAEAIRPQGPLQDQDSGLAHYQIEITQQLYDEMEQSILAGNEVRLCKEARGYLELIGKLGIASYRATIRVGVNRPGVGVTWLSQRVEQRQYPNGPIGQDLNHFSWLAAFSTVADLQATFQVGDFLFLHAPTLARASVQPDASYARSEYEFNWVRLIIP